MSEIYFNRKKINLKKKSIVLTRLVNVEDLTLKLNDYRCLELDFKSIFFFKLQSKYYFRHFLYFFLFFILEKKIVIKNPISKTFYIQEDLAHMWKDLNILKKKNEF